MKRPPRTEARKLLLLVLPQQECDRSLLLSRGHLDSARALLLCAHYVARKNSSGEPLRLLASWFRSREEIDTSVPTARAHQTSRASVRGTSGDETRRRDVWLKRSMVQASGACAAPCTVAHSSVRCTDRACERARAARDSASAAASAFLHVLRNTGSGFLEHTPHRAAALHASLHTCRAPSAPE